MLGCPVDVVDMAAAVRTLIDLVERHRRDATLSPAVVVTINPEMVMLARRDGDFASLLELATLLVPDGIGIVRALHRRGHPEAVRVGGADLIGAYLPEAERRAHRIALVGGAPGVARAARDRMVAAHPRLRVVAASAGAPDALTASRLAEAKPEIVLAAFGAGRQEQFLDQHSVRSAQDRHRRRRFARLPRRTGAAGARDDAAARLGMGMAARDPTVASSSTSCASRVLVARTS